MKSAFRFALMALVAAGLVCSAIISMRRIQNERRHHRIDVIVDYADLRRLAPVHKGGLEQAMKTMARAGATGIGVYEDNIVDLEDAGWVALEGGGRRNRFARDLSQETGANVQRGLVVRVLNEEHRARIVGIIRASFGEASCTDEGVCVLPYNRREIEELSLGFTLPETDLAVSLRPRYTPFDTERSVQVKLASWDQLEKRGPVVFDGTSVLGFPRLIPPVISEIRKRPDMRVGFLELVGQQGMNTIAAKQPGQILQTHSITELEMVKIGLDAAVRRLVRAVRERRVQVLYLRLFVRDLGLPPEQAFAYNVDYVKQVSAEIRRAGYSLGSAEPVGNLDVPWILRAGAVSGAMALIFLLAGSVFRVPWVLAFMACVLVFPVYPVMEAHGMGILVLKASALFIGCFAPGLAVSALFLYPQRNYDGPGRTMPLMQNVTAFLAMCLITAAAGFMAGSAISHRDFFIRIEMFAGVKLALVFPLLIVTYAWLRTCRFSVEAFLQSPLRYMEAVAGVIILGVAAVYLMRSGNESAMSPLGGQERHFRDWLEAVLIVRPRTKEFLMGHPAMILLGLVPFTRKNYLFLVILLAGTIGQASLFNTFCHIHTPLPLTLARVVLGVLIGMVLGVSLRLAWMAGTRLWRGE